MDFNSDINEEKFSHLTYMVIRKEGIDDIEIPLVSIADKTTPHLSVEMLSHMKNNINDVKQDDLMMWIPLKDFHRLFQSTRKPLQKIHVQLWERLRRFTITFVCFTQE